MFERSTLDYLTSKAIVADLEADKEKPWAEWSRGKPITEKGVAGLLHEYRIFSRNVGPEGAQAKGYRKTDFADAWDRYLASTEEIPPSDPNTFRSSRPAPCNDYAFDEKSAVQQGPTGREKIEGFSSGINALDGWTAEKPE